MKPIKVKKFRILRSADGKYFIQAKRPWNFWLWSEVGAWCENVFIREYYDSLKEAEEMIEHLKIKYAQPKIVKEYK